MKRFWNTLKDFFTSGKAQHALEEAARLATDPRVQAVVEAIAKATPTRADDEIVALCKQYAVPVAEQYLQTPQEDRGHVLCQIAVKALAPMLPQVARAVVVLAVDTAVVGLL